MPRQSSHAEHAFGPERDAKVNEIPIGQREGPQRLSPPFPTAASSSAACGSGASASSFSVITKRPPGATTSSTSSAAGCAAQPSGRCSLSPAGRTGAFAGSGTPKAPTPRRARRRPTADASLRLGRRIPAQAVPCPAGSPSCMALEDDAPVHGERRRLEVALHAGRRMQLDEPGRADVALHRAVDDDGAGRRSPPDTLAPSPMTSTSLVTICPVNFPSMRTCPSKVSFPSNSLPLPRQRVNLTRTRRHVFLLVSCRLGGRCVFLVSAEERHGLSFLTWNQRHDAIEVFVGEEVDLQRAFSAASLHQTHLRAQPALQLLGHAPHLRALPCCRLLPLRVSPSRSPSLHQGARSRAPTDSRPPPRAPATVISCGWSGPSSARAWPMSSWSLVSNCFTSSGRASSRSAFATLERALPTRSATCSWVSAAPR